jgi:excisionase family DNA binding protein
MTEPRTIPQKYLSPKELSDWIGVDVTTVYGWTSDRQIPFVKIGRLVRFDPARISIWLKQKTIPCVADLA